MSEQFNKDLEMRGFPKPGFSKFGGEEKETKKEKGREKNLNEGKDDTL